VHFFHIFMALRKQQSVFGHVTRSHICIMKQKRGICIKKDSKVRSPFKPRFLKFMTGSFRLRIGIISVVIGGHFGGGDYFDGGDHFGGGKPVDDEYLMKNT